MRGAHFDPSIIDHGPEPQCARMGAFPNRLRNIMRRASHLIQSDTLLAAPP